MHLTPRIVPAEQLHLGGWLVSDHRHAWYYFLRKRRGATRSTNKRFIQSVDKPLRSLVRYLHEHHIATTPSCSGHMHQRERLSAVYDTLEQEADQIRNGGLQLKDVETNGRHRYRDADYALPWSREDFIRRVKSNQCHGALGLRLGRRARVRSALHALDIPGLRVEEHDRTTFVLTTAHSESAIVRSWHSIAVEVRKILGE